jgi:hypothetical protein
MAEVCRWLIGQRELCETLEIRRFTELESRPAHYALGCLALEGLVHEVISTNWDTCIERALSDLRREPMGPDGTGTTYSAISSLNRYRRYGATRRRAGGAAVLRLYKINGCALEYTRQPGDETAERIVATERQLQDFGKRRWARDLLRDRARSRTLLFSGFGSDEPQVRHAVLELMEEFLQDGQAAPDHELFVTAYQPYLSFSQQQILRAFCSARKEPGRSVEDTMAERSVTGRDAAYFEIAAGKLPADHFWCALFEAAIEGLLRQRYMNRGFALWMWLEAHATAPAMLREQLLRWLFPPERRKHSAFRCAVPGLFGPNPMRRGFVLMRWLEAMQGKPPSGPVPRYCALRDRREPLLPLATLATLFALAALGPSPAVRLSEFVDRINPQSGNGLRITAPPVAGGPPPFPAAVSLVAEGADEPDEHAAPADPAASRVEFVVTVPKSVARHAKSRLRQGAGTGRVVLRTRYGISAAKLLELPEADKLQGWQVLARLFAEREDPRDERRRRRLRRERANGPGEREGAHV